MERASSIWFSGTGLKPEKKERNREERVQTLKYRGEMEKEIIVDGRGHLIGRLAATIAKELLKGRRITVVRCEKLNISGPLARNLLKFKAFVRIQANTNPRRGPFHERSPSRILQRTVRGMLPHKKRRGNDALHRLMCYDGIPQPLQNKPRKVVPGALRVNLLKPYREFTILGDLSKRVGWTYGGVVGEYEERRREVAAKFFKRKLAKKAVRKQALESKAAELEEINRKLALLGY